MKWKVIPEEYLNYLRQFESHIPYTNYGKNSIKPFFGVLFEKDDLVYVTQVSSVKPRHYSMTNNIDFFKIFHPRNDKLIGVVNLNYMFPAPKSVIKDLEYKNISQYRDFKDDKEKSRYIDLLKKEMQQIKKLSLEERSLQIYTNKYKYPKSQLAQRCLDYKNLEMKAIDWLSQEI